MHTTRRHVDTTASRGRSRPAAGRAGELARPPAAWLTLALGLAVAIPARAQGELGVDRLLSLSLEDLLQVNVVSKSPELLAQAPAVVTVYTRQDLDRLRPRNLMDLIELTAGFLVERDEDDMVWGTRGVITDNNQKFMVALDGHRISNNSNFGVNPFHKTRYLIDIAERIEIIRGPGGVLWGPDAFLGLVHVVSRKPEPGDEGGRAGLVWGPGEHTWHGGASYGRVLGDGSRVSGFVDAMVADGEPIRYDLSGRGGIDTVPGGYHERFQWPNVVAGGRWEGERSWLAGQVVEVEPFAEGAAPDPVYDRSSQRFVEAGHRRRLGRAGTLVARGYGDYWNAVRRSNEFGLLYGPPESRFGGEVTLESELRPGLTTVVGWDTRWYRYTGGPLAEDLLPFSRNGHMTAIGDLFHNGLFGQLTGRFGDLTLHLGGRFDDFSDHVRSLFVPRLALGYRFNDRWQAKVLYTEGALRPSWVQIGAWFSVDSTDIDTSLEPEESRTIELSTALDLDDFAATVSAYRTRVAGAINFVRGPRGWGFYNYADYTTWGVEVESKLRLGHHLEMFLNLTGYFDAARSEKVELVVPEPGGGDSWGAVKGEDDAYNLPPVFLAGGATLRLPLGDRRLELTPILRYRGKRTLQGIPGQASDIDVDTLMADLKGRLVLGPKLELTLNGRNVLDERGVVGVSSGRAGFAIPQGPVWEAGVQTRF